MLLLVTSSDEGSRGLLAAVSSAFQLGGTSAITGLQLGTL